MYSLSPEKNLSIGIWVSITKEIVLHHKNSYWIMKIYRFLIYTSQRRPRTIWSSTHEEMGIFYTARHWSLSSIFCHLEVLDIHIHSKNTRVRNWPGKGPLGPNSIPGQRWPGNQSTWHNLTQSWDNLDPIICQVCRKLTNFRVLVDPEWSLAPMDPFRVTLTRVFLECMN